MWKLSAASSLVSCWLQVTALCSGAKLRPFVPIWTMSPPLPFVSSLWGMLRIQSSYTGHSVHGLVRSLGTPQSTPRSLVINDI